jgi:hypothetical protein
MKMVCTKYNSYSLLPLLQWLEDNTRVLWSPNGERPTYMKSNYNGGATFWGATFPVNPFEGEYLYFTVNRGESALSYSSGIACGTKVLTPNEFKKRVEWLLPK